MFRIEDTVRYSTTGVCKIAEIIERPDRGISEKYYVLRPVHDARSTLFVPVNNPALVEKMLPVISKKEVLAFVDEWDAIPLCWIPEEQERRKEYRRRMIEGDRPGIAGIIKTLYHREKVLKEKSKKLRLDDERSLRDAERLLYDEVAYVLDIAPEAVPEFIRSRNKI